MHLVAAACALGYPSDVKLPDGDVKEYSNAVWKQNSVDFYAEISRTVTSDVP